MNKKTLLLIKIIFIYFLSVSNTTIAALSKDEKQTVWICNIEAKKQNKLLVIKDKKDKEEVTPISKQFIFNVKKFCIYSNSGCDGFFWKYWHVNKFDVVWGALISEKGGWLLRAESEFSFIFRPKDFQNQIPYKIDAPGITVYRCNIK